MSPKLKIRLQIQEKNGLKRPYPSIVAHLVDFVKHKQLKRTFFALFAAFFLLSTAFFSLFTAPATYASVEDFSFKSFEADYYLTKAPDGTSILEVKEKLVADFPWINQNHGITRAIPFTNNNGDNLTIENERALAFSVTRNGQSEPFSISKESGYYEVRIGNAKEYVKGEQTYELSYKFTHVILDQAENNKTWQELYWDTNGTGWAQPFGSLTARLHLPADLLGSLDADTACYVGKQGSGDQSRCTTKKTSDGYEFSARNLIRRENLTFVVGFAPDTFIVLPPRQDYLLLIIATIHLIFGAVCIAIAIAATEPSRKMKRDYKALFLAPEYTPPLHWTVAELGKNYLYQSDLKDSRVATLLELAVKHKIELAQSDTKKKSWKVIIKDVSGLKDWEQNVLKILARSNDALVSGQEIEMKKDSVMGLDHLFTEYEAKLERSLEKKEMFIPKKERKLSSLYKAAIILTILWIISSIGTTLWMVALIDGHIGITFVAEAPSLILNLASGVIISVVCIVLLVAGHKYTYRTEESLKFSRYLDGLKLYISMAEADRLKLLQSVDGADTSNSGIVKLYEKLLPYAQLLGLEKSWLKEMERYYQMEDVMGPSWCRDDAWRTIGFYSMMSSLSSTARAAETRYSESSSSSGGSGFSGGFSGGGGGGGGGGGW